MKLKLQPVLIALTAINMGLMIYLVGQSAVAAPNDDGILRGRGLQIIDAGGKVRASITLFPAEKLKDGSTYPETVLLRLITSEGRPSVKIQASEDGGGMALSAGKGDAYAQLMARGDTPQLVMVDKDGRKLP